MNTYMIFLNIEKLEWHKSRDGGWEQENRIEHIEIKYIIEHVFYKYE